MKLAYRAIDLSVQNDAVPKPNEPFPEVAAAHLLVEMAKSGEASDAAGRPLLTEEEIERLERYYGATDPASKQIKIRRLTLPLTCYFTGERYDNAKRRNVYTTEVVWPNQYIYVWDWGRAESPTEFQFRNLERATGCKQNDLVRRTLIDIFEQSKKSKLAFADLTDQKVRIAHGQSAEPAVRERNNRRCRRRRC